ncbi:nuclear transport factor 2 family protein [Thermodesulfobacteriota bacterium]
MDEKKLHRLLDRMEISDTVIRYATGIDMCNWDLFRTCFTNEIEVDFSSFSGAPPQKISADDWVDMVRTSLGGFRSTQHLSTNHVITIDGDRATCISYMQAQHYLPNDKGDSSLTLGGYYTNKLVRTDNGWKICNCKLTVTWSTGNRHVFKLAQKQLSNKK